MFISQERLKKLIPLFLAIPIFYYLFQQYPIAKLWQAVEFADISAFFALSIGYFLYMWFIDSWSHKRIFQCFGHPIHLKRFGLFRLASYPLALLHYGSSQLLLAYFLKKDDNIPLWRGSGIAAFIILLDLYIIISFAFIASQFLQQHEAIIAVSQIVAVIWIIASTMISMGLVLWRYESIRKKFQWLTKYTFFSMLNEITIKNFMQMLCVRIPLHFGLCGVLWLLVMTFQASIALPVVIAYMPLAILMTTLPVTPGGIGVFQLVVAKLFQSHIVLAEVIQNLVTPAELLIAMSLAFQGTNYCIKVVVGLFVMTVVFGKSWKNYNTVNAS